MNELTILVGMLSAPALVFIAWVLVMELVECMKQSKGRAYVRAYVQSHSKIEAIPVQPTSLKGVSEARISSATPRMSNIMLHAPSLAISKVVRM